MMIDYLSGTFDCELPGPLFAGSVAKFDREGVIEWSSLSRVTVEGSWSTQVLVRAVDACKLEISGNIAKFLQGHNIWGGANAIELVEKFLSIAAPKLWPNGDYKVNVASGVLSRIDVTSGYLLDRPSDVLAWLKAADERGNIAYRGRGHFYGTSLVFGHVNKGQRAKGWQLTIYSKGHELCHRPAPAPCMSDPQFIDYVNRLLRIEVRLRTPELKRMSEPTLKVSARAQIDALKRMNGGEPSDCCRDIGYWDHAAVRRVWVERVGRLELMECSMMSADNYEGVKPRLLHAYNSWLAGFDMRVGLKKSQYYQLRREMLATFGADIAIAKPKSNVVPLRRVIEAVPVDRPDFADRIDALLRVA